MFAPSSFVVCHHNIFHRGTVETLGQRRIMLKVSVDRTRDPTHASWRHLEMPSWSPETIESSPWVPAVFSWMAGQPPPKLDPGPAGADAVELLEAVLYERDSRAQARACWHLATQHPGSGTLTQLLQLLSECTDGVSTATATELAADAREVRLATTIAAFGAVASLPLRARLAQTGVGSHERAMLLDVLLDCAVGGEETERHTRCFAEAALDSDDWVRHNAIQGLEMVSGGAGAKPAQRIDGCTTAGDRRVLLLNALDDSNSMVAFNAVSALYNFDAARGSEKRAARDLQAAAARMEARGREPMLCFKAARIAEFNRDRVAAERGGSL